MLDALFRYMIFLINGSFFTKYMIDIDTRTLNKVNTMPALAARELQTTDISVIDAAYKYGYDSPER